MNEDNEIIRGSGNVFRDLGHPDADREQLRALLAARIIGVLDERQLTVRAAGELTGVAAADFSRIRKAKLDRFTIDRLMTILAGLGQEVEVTVKVQSAAHRHDALGTSALSKCVARQRLHLNHAAGGNATTTRKPPTARFSAATVPPITSTLR